MIDHLASGSGRPRLLITGVDGALGANLAMALADRWEVLGLFQDHPVRLDGCETRPWNPADPREPGQWVRRHRPGWIIHCGPLSLGSWDLPAESLAQAEAPRLSRRLGEAAADAGSRLTVLSTDALFAGPRMFHHEQSRCTRRWPPVSVIRQTERAAVGGGALVVRTHAYGWSPPGTPPGLAEQLWQSLAGGLPCPSHSHWHATPILATSLAELLLAAFRCGLRGIYHIAGAERTSVDRFAQEMSLAMGLPRPCVESRAPGPRGQSADDVRETSLDTRKARRDLRRPMPGLRDDLDRFVGQAQDGYRAQMRRGAMAWELVGDAA